MTQNLEFSLEEVYNEVLRRRQSEGAMTHDEYMDIVEEVLEEKREDGLIDDDYDFTQARESLESRWEEIASTASDENDTEVLKQD